jgi:hypothetical protein
MICTQPSSAQVRLGVQGRMATDELPEESAHDIWESNPTAVRVAGSESSGGTPSEESEGEEVIQDWAFQRARRLRGQADARAASKRRRTAHEKDIGRKGPKMKRRPGVQESKTRRQSSSKRSAERAVRGSAGTFAGRRCPKDPSKAVEFMAVRNAYQALQKIVVASHTCGPLVRASLTHA